MTIHDWLGRVFAATWPALGEHLWQATVIVALCCAASALLRRAPARFRYAVWLVGAAKFALPSAAVAALAAKAGLRLHPLISAAAPEAIAPAITQVGLPLVRLAVSPLLPQQEAGRHLELYCALTAVWLAGCALCLAVWSRRKLKFARMLREGEMALSGREPRTLARVASALGIRPNVGLVLGPSAVEPGVWGVWRPVVVLPGRMADELTDAELEAVLTHEAVHIARRDNLVANLQLLLCSVFWFHPLVWLVDRRLLLERERACDERVIAMGRGARAYAAGLLKVVRFCLGTEVAGISRASGANLKARVENIMKEETQRKPTLRQRSVLAGLVAAAVAVTLVTAAVAPRAGATDAAAPAAAAGPATQAAPKAGDASRYDLDRVGAEIPVAFDNPADAPLRITSASLQVVRRTGEKRLYVVRASVGMTSATDRPIRGVTMAFRQTDQSKPKRVDTRVALHYERPQGGIAPRASYTSRDTLRLAGEPSSWRVRVGGVVFEDGDVWGDVPPPPPPPPPPPAARPVKPPPPPPPPPPPA